MAEQAVRLGGASHQEIAFKLMERVAAVEGRTLTAGSRPGDTDYSDRKYILDTYAECLLATYGNRHVPKG